MCILKCINLSKQIGNLNVIKDLTFQLAEGEILCLIGPNGAGKTTLIHLITGLISYSSGDILFYEKSLRSLKPYQIAQLGITKTYDIVPPSTQMTALENVMVGVLFGGPGRGRSQKEARKTAEKMLDFIGLADQKDLPAINLNIFEIKRLAMAKALAINPKLLLLDEIMSGLNHTELNTITDLIKKIRTRGVSILVVEHLMKSIDQLSDRVIVLHHGEKIMEGPVDQVLTNEKFIQAYLGNRYAGIINSD